METGFGNHACEYLSVGQITINSVIKLIIEITNDGLRTNSGNYKHRNNLAIWQLI